ncbi:hypothetical protein HAX54_046751, partial [Datura stramonium]|nr:hypothetical protein [Datura stramonium]
LLPCNRVTVDSLDRLASLSSSEYIMRPVAIVSDWSCGLSLFLTVLQVQPEAVA